MRSFSLTAATVLVSCFVLVAVGCSRQPNDVVGDLPSTAESAPDAASDTPASQPAATHHAAFYTVDHYDESRDPAVDLQDTTRRAEEEKKRILLQVGGDWCGWCARISSYMETNEVVRDLLDENYVVMKVTFPGGENTESFLSQYPKIAAYPHLFVLDSNGTFLHSQGTGELEEQKSYNERAFRDFLVSWKPQRSSSTE